MIKSLAIIGGLLGLAAAIPSDKATPFPSIDSKGKLLWKSKIGIGSFRNNIVLQGNLVWMGSNGESFMDYGLIEPSSGVYAIDRRTGKKVQHFSNELFGDMDVAGLLLYNNRVYFGNDNEEFLCTDINGKIRWRNPASGDIEHEPVLLRTKGGVSIVYATETGEVKAVDPETGKTRWSYYTPDFQGWKPGDNRSLFKVKAWFSNTYEFYTKPLVLDLNLDGTNDLVYRMFGGSLLALDGNSGRSLWKVSAEDGLDLALAVVGKGSNKRIVSLRSYSDSGYTSHNEFCVYGLDGKRILSTPIPERYFGNGLNALEIDADNVLLNGLIKSYLVNANGVQKVFDRSIMYQDPEAGTTNGEVLRNDDQALVADGVIKLSNGKRGVVVMNQHDRGNYEFGFLEILSLEDGTVIDRITLPCVSEMAPVIRDVNMDGNLDILVSGYDGFLYCYQLPKY